MVDFVRDRSARAFSGAVARLPRARVSASRARLLAQLLADLEAAGVDFSDRSRWVG